MSDETSALDDFYMDEFVKWEIRHEAKDPQSEWHGWRGINVGCLCSDDYGRRRKRKKRKHKSNGCSHNSYPQKVVVEKKPTKEERIIIAINKYTDVYNANKSAKVGETITCPICGKTFVKKQYSQAFDSLKCKNTYWDETKGDRHKK